MQSMLRISYKTNTLPYIDSYISTIYLRIAMQLE